MLNPVPHDLAPPAFAALAHPLRRSVIEELACGERAAMDLAEGYDVTPGALSQHLKILREAGVVSRRRQGRQQLYRLEPDPLFEVMAWTQRVTAFWETKLDSLGGYLEKKHGQND